MLRGLDESATTPYGLVMLWFLALVVLGGLFYGPQWWAKRVITRHSVPRVDIPQSGSEFAHSLIRHVSLDSVEVDLAPPAQDHYDPTTRQVKLSPPVHSGRSLASVVIAAHEVGHAMQHQDGYWPLEMRTKLVKLSQKLERLGSFALIAMPVLGLVTRSPRVSAIMAMVFVVSMVACVLVHLITLPGELVASFNRALPYLRDVEYMRESDLKGAKQILWAAALTYVAQSLASLLNVWRWLRLLRR